MSVVAIFAIYYVMWLIVTLPFFMTYLFSRDKRYTSYWH